MKYMLLIQHGDAPTPYDDDWESVPDDQKQKVYAGYQAINQNPNVTPGLQMGPAESATTVRVENGEAITTDGPFVAVKEAVGGFLTLEAENLDEAIELAVQIPAASMGGAVEVRPLVER